MSLLFPSNITEQFISPFVSGNDPTGIIGEGLVISGGFGGVPASVTFEAAGFSPYGFNPHFGGSLLGNLSPEQLNQMVLPLSGQADFVAGLFFGFDPATSPVNFGTYAMGQLGMASPTSFSSPIVNPMSIFDTAGLSGIGMTPEAVGLFGF